MYRKKSLYKFPHSNFLYNKLVAYLRYSKFKALYDVSSGKKRIIILSREKLSKEQIAEEFKNNDSAFLVYFICGMVAALILGIFITKLS